MRRYTHYRRPAVSRPRGPSAGPAPDRPSGPHLKHLGGEDRITPHRSQRVLLRFRCRSRVDTSKTIFMPAV